MTEDEISNLPNLPYAQLNILDVLCEGEIAAYLNSEGFAHKTVCPECRVDDFCHVEGCSQG